VYFLGPMIIQFMELYIAKHSHIALRHLPIERLGHFGAQSRSRTHVISPVMPKK
jgi:hypothetical protein